MTGVPSDPPPFPPFPVSSSRKIYESDWCALRLDQVELEDGGLQEYHVFQVAPAVCVVPVLPDGSLLMLWQFRHPHGKTHWEIPAGRIDESERPEDAAQRELVEETGHRAARLEPAFGFYPVNGISPHYAHVFIAHGCVEIGPTAHDPSERMSVWKMPPEEARERLHRGEFEDGFTALALFHYFTQRGGDTETNS